MSGERSTARRPACARGVTFSTLSAAAALTLALGASTALADRVSQTATDAAGETSLIQGQHWGAGVPNGVPVAGTPPSAGYDYTTAWSWWTSTRPGAGAPTS